MVLLDFVRRFYDVIHLFDSRESLAESLSAICKRAGFTYFAIAHHENLIEAKHDVIRLHNYPSDWAAYFDAHELGVRDPIHRASQLRGSGFAWSALPHLLPLTPDDHEVLALARKAGIGDGYTVPFHVPGERSGSCSFAVSPDACFPHDKIPLAQALGSFAFEAARDLIVGRTPRRVRPAQLTTREREIVVWLGHGKPEKEIARLLGISPSTVNDHLKHARARCGVSKSSLLVVWGLLSGSITYNELLEA